VNETGRLLRRILAHLEERIDLAHVESARRRQRAALSFQPVDRLPLTICIPYQGVDFVPYSAAQAIHDPAKMMVNELLVGFTSLYHAVDLRDDAPYALRPNFGTTIIASTFGAEVVVLEDTPPWVLPLGVERIRDIVKRGVPELGGSLWARVIEQYAFYRDAVGEFPRCAAALQFTLPDLQGPFSVAELLWGGDIYLAFHDEPDLIRALLARVTGQISRAYEALQGMTHDTLGDGFCYQHAVGVRGRLLIRNDSIINISPRAYREIVMPSDEELSRAVGGAGVHFCGNGMHQAENLISIPGVRSLDLGQPEMLDLDALYARAVPREVALLRVSVPQDDLQAEPLGRRFPTGVNLTAKVDSPAEAHDVLARYLGPTR